MFQSPYFHSCYLSPCTCGMNISITTHVSTEVKSVSIDVGKKEVLVETALTSAAVQALIEDTGLRAVLKGVGGLQQGEKPQNGRRAVCQRSLAVPIATSIRHLEPVAWLHLF